MKRLPGAPGTSLEMGTPAAAHKFVGGVTTSQAAGSLRARLTSTSMPKLPAFPISSQRQTGLLSTIPASSGQQALSGTVMLLPVSTYVKQSDMLSTALKQSSDGAGAGAWPETPRDATRSEAATTNAMNRAVVMLVERGGGGGGGGGAKSSQKLLWS